MGRGCLSHAGGLMEGLGLPAASANTGLRTGHGATRDEKNSKPRKKACSSVKRVGQHTFSRRANGESVLAHYIRQRDAKKKVT